MQSLVITLYVDAGVIEEVLTLSVYDFWESGVAFSLSCWPTPLRLEVWVSIASQETLGGDSYTLRQT